MEDLPFKELLDNLSDGVYFVDRERRITYWNQAAETISGYSKEDVLDNYCMNNLLRHVDEEGMSLCLTHCPLSKTIQDGNSHSAEIYLHHKEGHRVPVSVRVSPIRNSQGEIVGAVEIFSDSSTNHAAFQRLRELEKEALVDALTGLPNRRWLEMMLRSRYQEFDRYQWKFGVLFMDVDHFKQVNDLHGHQAGDLLLKAVAKTLSGSQREYDFTGRWGGEEFLAIIPHADGEILNRIANRFRTLVEKCSIPYSGQILKVTISIGGSLIQPAESMELLLQRADELLYESKRQGRNRITIAAIDFNVSIPHP
jgi:diguanylate cyclase (GGDEF)-like protein/PAS domain S-box-containing protein